MAVLKTNYVGNPSFEGTSGLNGWAEYNKSTGLYSYLDTSNHTQGGQSLRIVNESTGDYGRVAPISSLPAGTYTMLGAAQTIAGSSSAPFTQACLVVRRADTLAVLGEVHWGTPASGAWVQKTATFTLTEAAPCEVVVGLGSYGAKSGGSVRFDAIGLISGSGATYFDGSFVDTATLDYAWVGTAHASPSTASDPTTGGGSTGGGSTGGGSTGGGSTGGGTPIAVQGWNVVQTVDPSGWSVVDTSKLYIYNGFKGTNNTGDYKTAQTTLEDGKLVLQCQQDNISGLSTQLRPLTYGRYDIDIRVTPVRGYKPVMFLWPDPRDSGDGKGTYEHWSDGEIDFFECTDSTGATYEIFLHKPGNPTDNSKQTRVNKNITGVFNKVTVEWLPGRISCYFNDQKVFEVTDTAWIPTKPMHLVFQWDVGVPGSANGIAVRDGYPAATTTRPRVEISRITISQPANGWYGYGAPPTPSGTTLDQQQVKARAIYDAFMSYSYTTTDGIRSEIPAGAARIRRPDQGNDTVSEGMGYAMRGLVGYGNPTLGVYDSTAKAKFQALWTFVKYYLNENYVMKWQISPTGVPLDTGGATDGDQDIAVALVLAHRLGWSTTANNYGAEATKMINGIRDSEYVPATGYANPHYQLNGDHWGVTTDRYMSDYFDPAAMRIFYEHTGDASWLTRIDVNYPVARGYWNTNYNTGFVPDESLRSGAAVPTKSYIWGYNAIRSPWRTVNDYLWYGNVAPAVAKGQADKLVAFIKGQTGANPANMHAEYSLDGSTYANYTNLAFVQAAGVAAVASSTNTQFAADALDYLYAHRIDQQSYFGSGLAMVSAMTMTGIAQPYSVTAPGKSLSAKFVGEGTGAAKIIVRRPVATSGIGEGSGFATLTATPKLLAATGIGAGTGSASLRSGTTAAPVALSARFSGEGFGSASVYGTPQLLNAFGGGEGYSLATVSTEHDLTRRPPAGEVAERIYAKLDPWTTEDADNGWALLRFVIAACEPLQRLETLIAPDDRPTWANLVDLNTAPSDALAYLAQFVGVDLIEGLDDESQRLRIRETSGFQRGTRSAIEGAARQYLTGNKTVVVQERDTSAYHLKVTTFFTETPDPDKVAAALQAQKPAGLVLEFVVSTGASYNALKATGKTYNQLKADYPLAKQMKLAVLV